MKVPLSVEFRVFTLLALEVEINIGGGFVPLNNDP
jgi:hypothetical protein